MRNHHFYSDCWISISGSGAGPQCTPWNHGTCCWVAKLGSWSHPEFIFFTHPFYGPRDVVSSLPFYHGFWGGCLIFSGRDEWSLYICVIFLVMECELLPIISPRYPTTISQNVLWISSSSYYSSLKSSCPMIIMTYNLQFNMAIFSIVIIGSFFFTAWWSHGFSVANWGEKTRGYPLVN